MTDVGVRPPGEDVVLLLQACNAAFGDRVLDDVRREIGDDVRFNDGYVFQHLVPGPCSISELARRLGISQQAASQQVTDLERRGLVHRGPDPGDARAKLVDLSERGRRMVEAGRMSREAIRSEVAALLGERNLAALLDGLRQVSDATGAVEHLAARRLRPEAQR